MAASSAAAGAMDPAAENAERGVAFVRVLAAVLSRLVETNDEVRARRARRWAGRGCGRARAQQGAGGARARRAGLGGRGGARDSVARTFASSCAQNGTEAAEITKFHALRPPGISVGDYLERYGANGGGMGARAGRGAGLRLGAWEAVRAAARRAQNSEVCFV
jgi:hypothetical protein